MSQRTFNALIARGFDVEIANRLSSRGNTLATLKSLDRTKLRALGIPEEMIDIIFGEARPPIPSETLNKVLSESRMTCCVCRDGTQGIIVHHIEEFSSSRSHDEDNLVVLCLNHHAEAHTVRTLQINLTADRIRDFKRRWLDYVRERYAGEAPQVRTGYSYEAIKDISAAVHYSTSYQSTATAPKFRLTTEESPDGRLSKTLTEEKSNELIWQLLQFPVDGYALGSIATDDHLIIGNFGGASILFYSFKNEDFMNLQLDSHEAGNRALLHERKQFGNSPVIRRYPPGDMLVIGNKLFVGQVFSEFVVVLDLASKAVVKRLSIGGEGCLSYGTNNNLVYFASNDSGYLAIIHPESYQLRMVPYPEPSLHIGTMFCHPDSDLVYIGLHRTNLRDRCGFDGTYPAYANSFIAVFNPGDMTFTRQIELALSEEDRLERCWPSSMIYDSQSKLLYVGMLGSPRNIYAIDTDKNEIVNSTKMAPIFKNKNDYVDSLSLSFYDNYLFAINRANYEMAVLEPGTLRHLLSIPLDGTSNGPRHICIRGERAYISHWEYPGIISVDLQKVVGLTKRIAAN